MIHAGRQRQPGGWWPANAQRRAVTVAGPHPVTVGMVSAIDRDAQRPLQGQAGHVAAGLDYTPGWRATLALLFDRPALRPRVAASAGRIRDANVALPGTSGERVGVAPAGSSSWTVADSLAAIPPGIR